MNTKTLVEGEWVRIGDFIIANESGELWITYDTGEGGSFDPESFEKVIKEFYKENF